MAFLLYSLSVLSLRCSAVSAWTSTTPAAASQTVSSLAWSQNRYSRTRMWSSASSASEKTVTGGTRSGEDAIPKTSIVTVDCRLVPENEFIPEPLIDGVVLHRKDPSVELSFALGLGNYLPGLHTLVRDMQVGDTVENVSLDAGWGSHNPNLLATLSFASVGMDKSQIKVGTQLYLPANRLTASVTEVTDETFVIDANPPLAGASYSATVTLKSIQNGPGLTPYKDDDAHDNKNDEDDNSNNSRYKVATFALGCFWGGELAFMREPGVVGTQVGYTQGSVDGPTYEQVCSGTTGHTEAIAVFYDSSVVDYERLVHLAMDRLGESKYLLNQVGNDKGTQYRHGIYYQSPQQLDVAKAILDDYGDDCVTECLPAKTFWLAEDYHQQYLLKGGQSARKGDSTTIRCYG